MAKSSRWLKLDKQAKVRFRVGSKKNVEIRIILPANRIKAQLKSLQP
jgi:hypothetical protein